MCSVLYACVDSIRKPKMSSSRSRSSFYRARNALSTADILGLSCNASHVRLVVAGSEDAELPDGCYCIDRAVAKKVYVCDSLYPAYRGSFCSN